MHSRWIVIAFSLLSLPSADARLFARLASHVRCHANTVAAYVRAALDTPPRVRFERVTQRPLTSRETALIHELANLVPTTPMVWEEWLTALLEGVTLETALADEVRFWRRVNQHAALPHSIWDELRARGWTIARPTPSTITRAVRRFDLDPAQKIIFLGPTLGTLPSVSLFAEVLDIAMGFEMLRNPALNTDFQRWLPQRPNRTSVETETLTAFTLGREARAKILLQLARAAPVHGISQLSVHPIFPGDTHSRAPEVLEEAAFVLASEQLSAELGLNDPDAFDLGAIRFSDVLANFLAPSTPSRPTPQPARTIDSRLLSQLPSFFLSPVADFERTPTPSASELQANLIPHVPQILAFVQSARLLNRADDITALMGRRAEGSTDPDSRRYRPTYGTMITRALRLLRYTSSRHEPSLEDAIVRIATHFPATGNLETVHAMIALVPSKTLNILAALHHSGSRIMLSALSDEIIWKAIGAVLEAGLHHSPSAPPHAEIWALFTAFYEENWKTFRMRLNTPRYFRRHRGVNYYWPEAEAQPKLPLVSQILQDGLEYLQDDTQEARWIRERILRLEFFMQWDVHRLRRIYGD